MNILILFPYLISVSIFFYFNGDIDRGEHGGLEYTWTKVLPILTLIVLALSSFDRPPFSNPPSCADPGVLALSNLFSAIGDLLLADRSDSLSRFTFGIIPFGVAHSFNTVCHSKLTLGPNKRRYCCPIFFIISGLGVIFGYVTLDGIIGKTNIPFQIISSIYSLLLGWSVWSAASNWRYNPKPSNGPSCACFTVGYVLFAVSDSMIMLDEFAWPIQRAQLFILITYYASMGLIFVSFAMHLSREKEN